MAVKKEFEPREKRGDKKAAVLASGKKGARGTLIGVGVAVLAAAFVSFVLFSGSGGFKTVRAEAGVVKVPVAEVNDGMAHYFTYEGAGKNINFFLLRSSDGVIRAAFDACDVCYREKKGYRQEGDYMVCNNCGQRFSSVKINEIKGGCNPAPLNRSSDGQNVLLNVSQIEEGGFYF